ncbi:MAG: APC family permease, partial [Erysipelotrichales bacterium]
MNKISFRQALLIAIGSSIGGGIYFKTDDVLMTSQGDVFLSTMGWIVLGGTFIFAGLAISILANRTKRDGGLIAYMEDCFGEKVGFATGWFFAIFYSPSQIAILAWVTATYGLQIFNFNSENIGVNGFYIVIFLTLVAMFTWNILSTKFAALVSAFSTSVKLIPLLLIPILAFIGLEPANFANITEGTSYVANNPEAIKMITEAGLAYNPDASWLTIFIGPLLAMAFTFDGWFTVGSLSVDMENPQKDLAKVFTISLSVVTFVYAVYHLGVNMLMPADEIIIAGDAHVEYAVRALFGGIFGESGGYAAAKVVIVIVTISVTGATNSFIMGANRYVQALAEEGNFFNPQKYRKFSVKTGTPLSSALAQGLCTFVLLMAYYLQEGHG